MFGKDSIRVGQLLPIFMMSMLKSKKIMRKTGQSVKCKVSPLLAKLLLPADISELPSIGWGCMHEEDAVMECKCPYAVRGMLISELGLE